MAEGNCVRSEIWKYFAMLHFRRCLEQGRFIFGVRNNFHEGSFLNTSMEQFLMQVQGKITTVASNYGVGELK